MLTLNLSLGRLSELHSRSGSDQWWSDKWIATLGLRHKRLQSEMSLLFEDRRTEGRRTTQSGQRVFGEGLLSL
jgi:hypothetical protein